MVLVVWAMTAGVAAEDDVRGWTEGLGENVKGSFGGWSVLVHAGAVGVTWAMAVSDVDAEVQRWSANRAEGPSIALSLPGLAGGWFAPAVVPLWLRYRGENVWDRNAGVAALQAVGIAVVTGNLLKAVSGRREPRWDRPEEAEARSRDFKVGFWRRGIYNGWPSGHAIANTALASALSNYYDSPRARHIAWSWAGLVMASATFGFQGDVHWASDVVAGGLIGWAIGRQVGRSFAGRDGKRSALKIYPSGLSLALPF